MYSSFYDRDHHYQPTMYSSYGYERDQFRFPSPVTDSVKPPSPENPPSPERAPPSPATLRKRRCIIYGFWGALIIAVGFLLFVIIVFRAKDLKITMNSITLQQLGAAPGSTSPLATNMTVVADISVKNPNMAPASFRKSTTSLYYRGELVGLVHGPPGMAPSKQTFRIVVSVDVKADQLMRDLRSGDIVEMSSYTNVVGRVKVLGMIGQDIDGEITCTMTVSMMTNMSVKNCMRL